jgi:hypothetical protein
MSFDEGARTAPVLSVGPVIDQIALQPGAEHYARGVMNHPDGGFDPWTGD